MRQPPRASRSTFSPIAIETRRGLDTDMIEPFFITAKSEQQQSQADDPNEVSSSAAVQGVSRIRRNFVSSLPTRAPIPFDPISSGTRAPGDSPPCTQGMPLSGHVLRATTEKALCRKYF